jgi:hypothetical protein
MCTRLSQRFAIRPLGVCDVPAADLGEWDLVLLGEADRGAASTLVTRRTAILR